MMGFKGARLSADMGFFLMRQSDQRHGMPAPGRSELQDLGPERSTRHSMMEMIRQRVFQMTAICKNSDNTDFFRFDPARRLLLGNVQRLGAGRPALPRLKNHMLDNNQGLLAPGEAIPRSADAFIQRKEKYSLILKVGSTKNPAHDKRKGNSHKGHFGKTGFHPIIVFTGDGPAVEPRPGKVNSADAVLHFVKSSAERYRKRFKPFRLRGEAVFLLGPAPMSTASENCEKECATCHAQNQRN
jgi:hypothetical protein